MTRARKPKTVTPKVSESIPPFTSHAMIRGVDGLWRLLATRFVDGDIASADFVTSGDTRAGTIDKLLNIIDGDLK